ncbi:IKBD inhibitor, partial [Polyodon spathula]|nr:IKBD inhibitor [Polyodon spathula]
MSGVLPMATSRLAQKGFPYGNLFTPTLGLLGCAPKEKLCYPPPTVKKLLEQKRKRETISASTGTPAASPSVPTPVQGIEPGQSSFPESMGAAGPVPQTGFNEWQQSQPSPPTQHNYYPQEEYFHYSPPIPGAYPPMSSSYSPVQTPPELHNFDEHVSSPLVAMALPQASSFHWPQQTGGQCQGTAGIHLFGASAMQMDSGQLEAARMFIQRLDISKKVWQDEDGDTILHIYTAKGLREFAYAAAEHLRELGKLDSKEHKGKTPLLVAVTANQPAIVQDLISLGADVNACDIKGQTALHLAATYGFPSVMRAVLYGGLSMPVDLEIRNFEGLTPLHCAVISHSSTLKSLASQPDMQSQAQDKLSCIHLLLQHGASPISQDIKSNKTVLHLAVKEGNLPLVQFLLELNYPEMYNFVNMKAHGNTALHMAAGLHGHCYQEDIVRLLLSRGADPSIRNLENDQAAHLLQPGERGEQVSLKTHTETQCCTHAVTE